MIQARNPWVIGLPCNSNRKAHIYSFLQCPQFDCNDMIPDNRAQWRSKNKICLQIAGNTFPCDETCL